MIKKVVISSLKKVLLFGKKVVIAYFNLCYIDDTKTNYIKSSPTINRIRLQMEKTKFAHR